MVLGIQPVIKKFRLKFREILGEEEMMYLSKRKGYPKQLPLSRFVICILEFQWPVGGKKETIPCTKVYHFLGKSISSAIPLEKVSELLW